MSSIVPLPQLSAEQRHALMMVDKRRGLFITGCAGAGKSVVVKAIQDKLREQGRRYFTTAPTGIAALNIGGCTLHSFCGAGLAKGTKEECYKDAMRRPKNVGWWRECEVLIIDEVSMLDPFFFEKLDYMARKIRNSEAFFGGIQVIAVGDFFQLPPVMKDHANNPDALDFVFELPLWKANLQQVIMLTQVHRQKDIEFVRLLAEIRQGRLSEAGLALLRSRIDAKIVCPEGLQPTQLFPTRVEASHANAAGLKKLPGEERLFVRKQATTGRLMGEQRQNACQKLDDNMQAEVELKLKVGAQVMLLTNLNVAEGLCNGSRGVVTSFDEECTWPIVKFANGLTLMVKPFVWTETPPDKSWSISNTQVPLKLAYGITIHKSQSLSIDLLTICLARVFERGQGYVALSRARTLAGLSLSGDFDPDIFAPHPKVVAFYQTLMQPADTPPVSALKLASKQPSSAAAASAECVICLDHAPSYLISPCGHKCICDVCSKFALKQCPICRIPVERTIRVFD